MTSGEDTAAAGDAANVAASNDGSDRSEISEKVRQHGRRYIFLAIAFSLGTNILMLVSPLYMIQVYDRVLTSSSFSTLASLSIIAVFLLMIYAFAESGRRRAMAVFGRNFADRTSSLLARETLSPQKQASLLQLEDKPTLQDASRIQSFLFSGGILPIIDLPFSPLFLALMFLLHPLIGVLGLVGGAILIGLAIISERATSNSIIANQMADKEADNYLSSLRANSSAIISMGMRDRLIRRWNAMRGSASGSTLTTSSVSSAFTSVTRASRQILQTVVLGFGAYLALKQQMSPGAIVAGSIVMGRALAPIDQVVGSWRQINLARQSWKKLGRLADEGDGEQDKYTPITEIEAQLECREIAMGAPGMQEPIIPAFSFKAEPGTIFGLIGPSGSGKSTFLQTLAGVWPLLRGQITLSNRNIAHWHDEDRGKFIGYLPQKVELLPGTIAENICRFTDAPNEQILGTARQSGAHQAIMGIPNAYDAVIGTGGMELSAGQQQVIGLARAFFNDPAILLLDEPTANMDSQLVRGFIDAIEKARDNGRIIIISTHDPRLLRHLDYVMSTANGRLSISKQKDVIDQLHTVGGKARETGSA